MVRDSQGKLVAVEWEDALVPVARALQSAKGDDVAAIVGGFADAEVSRIHQFIVFLLQTFIRFFIGTLGTDCS